MDGCGNAGCGHITECWVLLAQKYIFKMVNVPGSLKLGTIWTFFKLVTMKQAINISEYFR